MNDEDIDLTIERAAGALERARNNWRRGAPRALILFDLKLALKRTIKVWWHVRRTKRLIK